MFIHIAEWLNWKLRAFCVLVYASTFYSGVSYDNNLCYQPIECSSSFDATETGIEYVDEYGVPAARVHVRQPHFSGIVPLWKRAILRQSHRLQFLVGNDDASDSNSVVLDINRNDFMHQPSYFLSIADY